MVPKPVAADFDALNAMLLSRSLEHHGDVLRGHHQTIGERLVTDLDAFRPLPAAPFEPCDKRPGRVSSLSLVRYRCNDYSVPTQFGHREVLVKGFVDEVVIVHGNEVIARHPRSYDSADFVFDPLHYLALLDQAAPLQGWQLPEVFTELRRLLEARMGKRGRREFVQVLRLLEVFPLAPVTAAIKDAIERGAIAFDAVKHLTLCLIEQRPPRLDLSAYPFLPGMEVKTTAAADYMALLGEAA
jgi:hypothetical protein